MSKQFISEPINPNTATFDPNRMSTGEPGLPGEFEWRGNKYTVSEVLRSWRSTGPCRHGSQEQYTRRHWFEIRTETGETMRVYFDKGTRGKRKEMGWFLHSRG